MSALVVVALLCGACGSKPGAQANRFTDPGEHATAEAGTATPTPTPTSTPTPTPTPVPPTEAPTATSTATRAPSATATRPLPVAQVPTSTATPRPPTVAPTALPTASREECHPSYPTLCLPPPPPDLSCKDIGVKKFPVLPPDPHGFDGDKDGIGCE